MGNWSEQQDRKKEGKEKDKLRREKLAGYFFDLSKLIFAALVLGGLSPIFGIEYNIIDIVKLILGIISTVTFAIFANKILK